jgi:hypothetical protein
MPFAFCLLLLAGCAPPALLRQGWTPDQDPALILDHARRDLEALGDLKGAAELTLVQSGQRQHASAALLFKPPGLFRVEARGPLFVHLFTALLRGNSLIARTGDAPWRGGPFADELITQLLGLDLSGYDLRHALLGLVAPGTLDSLVQTGPGRCLAYVRGTLPRRLHLDTRQGLIAAEELLGAQGETLLIRGLQEYQRVGRFHLPRRVEIRQGDRALLLEYRSWAPDTGLDEAAFTRGIPLDRLEPLE